MNEQNNLNFKHFFDVSPDLLCIAGFDGYFKNVNPAVSQLLGYSKEELLSQPINNFIYKDDKSITAAYRGELTRNSPLQYFENRYLTKNGEIVWLSWTSTPVPDEKLIYAIAKNITHKKVLEKERNSVLINFTQSNYDIKQLFYTSSHDLRSPVNNLLSIFSLLDLSKIDDLETVELIKMLGVSSENLRDTLNDYLDIFIQRDNLKTKIEFVNLNSTLNSVILSVNSLIKTSYASIESNFSSLENISFNKAFMESIFLNLITNSIKYSKPSIRPSITISSRIQDGVKQLVFSDNGLGFDLELVKDKIFGLHQKFHNHADSRGIGLYLIHNHVTSLGGQITAESKVNEGTQFIISFADFS